MPTIEISTDIHLQIKEMQIKLARRGRIMRISDITAWAVSKGLEVISQEIESRELKNVKDLDKDKEDLEVNKESESYRYIPLDDEIARMVKIPYNDDDKVQAQGTKGSQPPAENAQL